MEKRIKIENGNDQKDIENLFELYLAICNKAIERHKDEFPYKEILSVTETMMGNRPIDLAIYDEKPKGAFSLKFKNNKLVQDGKPADVKKAWRVNLGYIEQVVKHPEEYIAHPEKLDLEWLKSRLGF
ncbi:hypothetical protein N9W34_00375 [Rickettsiales bacterium]|nr:hypothetical protein [Rickettsiales bacterium]